MLCTEYLLSSSLILIIYILPEVHTQETSCLLIGMAVQQAPAELVRTNAIL